MTYSERKEFNMLIRDFDMHPMIQSMKNYRQHAGTSTYEHSLHVAQSCFKLNKRLRLNANEEVLIPAALLHDFYLYDCKNKEERQRWHTIHHPANAAKNAKKYFSVSEDVEKIIRSHMWPLKVKDVPKSKEAMIVCLVDKYCAVKEFLLWEGKRRLAYHEI